MAIPTPPPLPEIWRSPSRGRVLVLAPHPDDETLGCGGLLALHRDQEDPVMIVFLTDGCAGDPEGYYPRDHYVRIRQAEARQAARALGVMDLEFWDYPDGRLSEARNLRERLRRIISAYAPDLLYYPSRLELHPDHWATAMAVEELFGDGAPPPAAYAYEVWAAIQPTHLIDITTVLARKEKAMAEYQSQLRYHDYRPKILGLNTYRSISLPHEVRYVEAFRRLR